MGKAGSKRTKKLRGSLGSRVGTKDHCDLMVPLPKLSSSGLTKLESELLLREIRERLSSTGFTHMALTHTIYGRPKPDADRAAVAIPDSLLASLSSCSSSRDPADNTQQHAKKRKRKESSEPKAENMADKTMHILRRLHVVVENQSDMELYVSKGKYDNLLLEYDLVSISPTNDATFQAACTTATMADIIALDYTGHGLRLPYRIRPADVKAATERGAAFEIALAPALLHLKQRKALVHASQELKRSSLGAKPLVVISSGDRAFEGRDVGALALRMPGDLSNLCRVVLRFDDALAVAAVGSAGMEVVRWGRERRVRKNRVGGRMIKVSFGRKADLLAFAARAAGAKEQDHNDDDDGNEEEEDSSVPRGKPNVDKKEVKEDEKSAADTDEDSNDGFIAL